MINQFGSRPALGADRRAGGVVWIGIKACKPFIGHRCHGSAAGEAKAAVPMYPPHIRGISWHVLPPMPTNPAYIRKLSFDRRVREAMDLCICYLGLERE